MNAAIGILISIIASAALLCIVGYPIVKVIVWMDDMRGLAQQRNNYLARIMELLDDDDDESGDEH